MKDNNWRELGTRVFIRDSLEHIGKQIGVELKYRNTMPDGRTAHYVQYRPDDKSAWMSTGMRDFKTPNELVEEILSWNRLLRCRSFMGTMRKNDPCDELIAWAND